MTQKSRSALITQARVIRDETVDSANTTTRVGTMHEDAVDSSFNKTTDDSDNITESSDKKFLDGSGDQIIAGIKEFTALVHSNNAASATKAFTATPTFAFGTVGNTHQMTLTGNVTTFATSGEVGSANMDVYLINDGTAGRTVAAPTGWTVDPTSETHTTAANAINRYQFYTLPDGAKYFNLHIVKS